MRLAGFGEIGKEYWKRFPLGGLLKYVRHDNVSYDKNVGILKYVSH